MWKIGLGAGLIGALAGIAAMFALNGYFVRSYLLSHPEILPEAIDLLRARESAEALRPIRPMLETPFHGAWAGAPDADVVLVEFFDYACGYCRAANPDVERLLREDPKLKVVWREYPVLGAASEQAAVASLAAAKANRFRQFHDALYRDARPTAATIAAASQAAGIGPAELTDEFRRELEGNFRLASMIGATGTPTFVIGDQVMQGAVGYAALKTAVEAARER